MPPITDQEIREHIKDCGWHMECAYARFQAHDDKAARLEAVAWLQMQTEAKKALSESAQAEREAEIQRSIDDGIDYFAVRGVADRERLAASAHA